MELDVDITDLYERLNIDADERGDVHSPILLDHDGDNGGGGGNGGGEDDGNNGGGADGGTTNNNNDV